MESFIEPIRYTTSLFALVTAAAVLSALRSESAQKSPLVLRLLVPWAVLAGTAGLIVTHVLGRLPSPALLPAVAGVGLVLGVAGNFSAGIRDRFDRLDDKQWRALMLLRAVFGALLLGAGGVGLMPPSFALAAGLGDLLAGGLALAVPGSIAAGGHRGLRLLVFGVGIVDFINVIVSVVTVVVPWLGQTNSLGISLLLPWLAVPLLAMVNLHGLRLVLAELFQTAPRASAAS